ncbi:MAG TPA: hypothetical protein VH413_15115 [Verrucomicrobiae bacterium]|jgi:hypothetical protein|nr:hypothetical protein [Verrucomicrobiae bacterium]
MKKKKTEKIKTKSEGTVISDKARAKANKYSDKQRCTLLDQGVALIYDGSNHN